MSDQIQSETNPEQITELTEWLLEEQHRHLVGPFGEFRVNSRSGALYRRLRSGSWRQVGVLAAVRVLPEALYRACCDEYLDQITDTSGERLEALLKPYKKQFPTG